MHVRRSLALAVATAVAVAAVLTVVVALARKPAPTRPLTRSPARDADGRCRGVALAPGADVRRAVDAHPGGTVFCLAAGTYRVRLVGQAGWLPTTAVPGPVALQSGQDAGGLNFGLFHVFTISGQVFTDASGGGRENRAEDGPGNGGSRSPRSALRRWG